MASDIITGREKREEEILKDSRNAFARAFLKTLQAYQLDASLDDHPEIFAIARAFILSTDYYYLSNRRLYPPGKEADIEE